MRTKTEVPALGVRKSMTARKNDRSASWIAPPLSNGCAMARACCYVPRHRGYANPITVCANSDDVVGYLQRHVARQGVKPAPDQCDPAAWVSDTGENSDASVDAVVSDDVRDLVAAFAEMPTARACFATERSHHGMEDVRYRARWKAVWVQRLLDLIAERTPWPTVRYAS